MADKSLLDKLKSFGIFNAEDYYQEAFSRNIGLLTDEEQRRLRNARVAIPGMGGVGGEHAVTMARLGIGRLHMADLDTFEPANINRQYGARVPDFGRPKLEVMAEHVQTINPFIDVTAFPQGISSENVDAFLDGVDVVIDGLDFFVFDVRRMLFKRAAECGIPVVTAGPMGFSSAMLVFLPYEGMRFDDYLNIIGGMPEKDRFMAFAMGLAPRGTHIKYMEISAVDFDKKQGPSLIIACKLCAGMAATEVTRILLDRGRSLPAPHFIQFDPYRRVFRKGRLHWGNRNPFQRLKMWGGKHLLTISKTRYNFLLKKSGWQYKSRLKGYPVFTAKAESVTPQIARRLIRAAIQAPSGDDVQAWQFSIESDRVNLYLNENADRSFFNVNQIASIIACGAALENLVLAAGAAGLEATPELLPDGADGDCMAAVALEPGSVRKSRLADAIWKRHTNRTFYNPFHRVPPPILEGLADAVSAVPGATVHCRTSLKDVAKLAQLIYKADRVRTEYRPLHEHLMQMLRFTQTQALDSRDGLPLKNLMAGLPGELFLKATRPWPVMRICNAIGLGRVVPGHAFMGMVSASGAGLVTIDGTGREDFLKGGMALQRAWLYLNANRIDFQPMTAITLFWHRWCLEGPDGFLKKHQKLLQNVFDGYRRMFPDIDFEKTGHVMLFRFGYGGKVNYGTYRKDLNAFLKKWA